MNPGNDLEIELKTFDPARESSREAADRTLMAWIRTSLALIGFGFGIAKYREILLNAGMLQRPSEEFNATIISGLSFIFLGTFALFAAVIQHWRLLQFISGKKTEFTGFRPLALVTAILLLCIGLFAFLAVILN
jgi:putative membrane protein